MQQYFVDQKIEKGAYIELSKEDCHHIINVLRMKNQDMVIISDGKGRSYYANIEISQKKVFAHIKDERVDRSKNSIYIQLFSCLIKKDKWDFMLQKVSEMGVDEIIPVLSSRCVVKNSEEKSDKKLIRWNKIVKEACEQCKRSTIPNVSEVINLKDVVSVASGELKLVAYEDANMISHSLKQILQQYPNIQSISLLVGCEGGFSEDEIIYLEEKGFKRVSLGGRILRAETASMAFVNMVAFHYQD